jgi:xanthine/uracil/vitamin C permease (AzgA family)
MALTVVLALVFNMAVGFFAGLALYHLMRRVCGREGKAERLSLRCASLFAR